MKTHQKIGIKVKINQRLRNIGTLLAQTLFNIQNIYQMDSSDSQLYIFVTI